MTDAEPVVPSTPEESGTTGWEAAAVRLGSPTRRPVGSTDPSELPKVATHDAKIMIVDDSPVVIEMIRGGLATVGYHDFVATTRSTEALSLIARERPDIILLDVLMPKISGLELLEELSGIERYARIPVIVVTIACDQETKLRALELGATDFLTKPLDPVELVARVRNCLVSKAHYDHLQTYAEDLERVVQQRTKELHDHALALEHANRALERLCDEARDAARSKSAFLSSMSHEIRTPLTAILGFAQLLIDPELSGEERASHVETIQRNGRCLLDLINNILDLAKLEASEMGVEPTRCSLEETVDDVVSLLQPLAAGTSVDLRVDYATPVPPVVETDPMRLRQILLNLMGNAVKFTEQGEVRVTVRCLERTARRLPIQIEVADTGIGMSAETTARLFAPFYQAEASSNRHAHGTGLGLAVSRHLAELLGGDIRVQSELGQGSVFTLTVEAALPE